MADIVLSVCERINTPRSLSVWLCFKYNHEALFELLWTDFADSDTERVRLHYFITEYLSKYKGLKMKVRPSQVALGKWKLSEQRNLETNQRLRDMSLRPFTGRVERTLFRAQRKIASVLGPLRLSSVLSDCKWGPGATFDLSRKVASPDKKISQAISTTSAALPYVRAIVESDPHWAACFLGVLPEGRFSLTPNCFTIVRGSRFLTVSKSAKTDRCIAAEPTGNGFLQQGVHGYMRRRLKRFGIDLDDQSINQSKARDAYFEGLSTLDLSAASDSITRELVFHLLPLDWALFLDSIRSPETRVEGKWVRTELFSSMGNAFTFELETLIFWALASSVDEFHDGVDSITVFGDDIIVPRKAFQEVCNILTFCGFVVNKKKSFEDGNFFESCGKHYHRGIEVTPVYQKEILVTRKGNKLVTSPPELIRAHNRLVRLSKLLPDDKKSIVAGATKRIVNLYPLRPLPRIPYGTVEDGGFLRPLTEFSVDRNHGFRCHVLDFVPRFTAAREDALYAYKLRRFMSQNPLDTGHAANVAKGKWRTKVRWVPEHAVQETEQ